MRNSWITLCFIVCSLAPVATSAVEVKLSLDAPACKMPKGRPLPAKYYAIANKWKEFRWVKKVHSDDLVVSKGGDERVDGSSMYDWYNFHNLDINGDGKCDWFLTSLAPYSTGGDSGMLNTIYLGAASGWKRIGADIPNDKPDGLGWGKANNQQAEFAFSSDAPLIVWDVENKKPYLIGWFATRHSTGRQDQEGYHIYRWSNTKNTLEELDKWEPNSAAAKVYAHFKQYGAVNVIETGSNRISEFDSSIEQSEFDRGCADEDVLKRSSHFAKACQSRKK